MAFLPSRVPVPVKAISAPTLLARGSLLALIRTKTLLWVGRRVSSHGRTGQHCILATNLPPLPVWFPWSHLFKTELLRQPHHSLSNRYRHTHMYTRTCHPHRQQRCKHPRLGEGRDNHKSVVCSPCARYFSTCLTCRPDRTQTIIRLLLACVNC